MGESAQEPVELTAVATEMEAAEVVGYLGESGIEAHYEAGGSSGWLDAVDAGAHRIFVRAGDLERARQLLDEANAG